MADRTALIVGATGLVGSELLKYILEYAEYDRVKVISRRELPVKDQRLEPILIPDFEQLEQYKDQLGAEDYYCTLGTTIKKAGSRSAFEKVDLTYPLKIADIATGHQKFKQFLVVTSTGAQPKSPLFYNQVKGRLEEELKSRDLPALKIFRPSLLLGHRSEVRIGEQIGKVLTAVLSFFMVRSSKALLSIHAADVAKAMVYVASRQRPGTEVFTSQKIYKLAKTGGKN